MHQQTINITITPQQKLAHIAEECSEFLKAYAKYHRFGMWPHFEGKNYNNFDDICNEIGDISFAIERFRAYIITTTPSQRKNDFK